MLLARYFKSWTVEIEVQLSLLLSLIAVVVFILNSLQALCFKIIITSGLIIKQFC